MSWHRTRLKHLCVDVGQYGLNISAEDYSSEGIRLIRTSDISPAGSLKPADEAVYVGVHLEDRYRLRDGDVLLSRSGTLGRSLLVPELGQEATYAGYLVRFRPRPGVDQRFLAYVTVSAPFQAAIQAEAISATIQNFNAERYANVVVEAPDRDEQRRIVDFLDVEISRIDRLNAAREAQIAALGERVYAMISETLVPGCLSTPGGRWPWTWLASLPADRPLVRLGYVCTLQTGLTVDNDRDLRGSVVTRPYLRVANVQADRLILDSVTEITVPRAIATRSTLRSGDVLMTEGGDLDKLGRGTVWRGELVGCLHQNHVFALRPDVDRLDGDYLALMTQTLHGRCYFESTGTKTTNLASTNSSKILAFPVPLPSVGHQRQLARTLRGDLEKAELAKATLVRQLALLAERRQALITAAVTGQIDVTTARGVDVS